jgi:hypothetical protein
MSRDRFRAEKGVPQGDDAGGSSERQNKDLEAGEKESDAGAVEIMDLETKFLPRVNVPLKVARIDRGAKALGSGPEDADR